MMETRNVRMGGWSGRSLTARAMGVVAVAGALLGSMARPAAAQILNDPTTPLRMDFFKLYCQSEQGDGVFDLHDEPYVVVWAANLRGPVAEARTLYEPFSDVDS